MKRQSPLGCQWLKWTNVNDETLRLDILEGQCPDMTGTIERGSILKPEVNEIRVHAGSEFVALYQRQDDDDWISI